MQVPLGIGDFLDRAALVYGQREAVVDEPDVTGTWGRITYAELQRRAWGMARALDAMGVGPGARVALLSPNAARFLCSYWGVSAYGRVLVPVNYRLNVEEVKYIVSHSGSTVLLVDPEYDEAMAGVEVEHRIVLDGVSDRELFAPADNPPEGGPWPADENDCASINYTSGTTARPKGVQLTHRNCWINAATFGWHMQVNDDDVLLHTLPMFHCNGWGMPYAATGMGAKHVVIRKIDGEQILQRVAREGVTLLCGAPAVVSAALDAATVRRERGEEVPGRDQVRIVVAGAPPPSKIIERVETELGWEFNQIYGLTETSPFLTINRHRSEWDGLDASARSKLLARAGAPGVGVKMRIDDQGEVCARANEVFAGYWEQPEETAKAIVDGWFHTGDGGYLDGEYLVIADRKKDVIITGGENVSSIEVEDALFQHPAVAEVAVIGVPDDKWGEMVTALVVLRSGEQVTEADLITFARSRLAGYKCPKAVEFRTELARTATGKLQKFKLRQPFWEGKERQVN
ncbi:MAG: AMP-binding protein [Acidimicrobiales bacterium]